MAAQSNVGQSMLFHHKWRFYSIFTGRSHTQRCELWMILIKCSCSAYKCVFAWLDLNGLQSDTVGCSVRRVPAVRNTWPFSLISSDAQTVPTKTQTHVRMHTQPQTACIWKCLLTFMFVFIPSSSEKRKPITSFVALCYE